MDDLTQVFNQTKSYLYLCLYGGDYPKSIPLTSKVLSNAVRRHYVLKLD